MTIVIRCYGCMSYNKHQQDEKDFEFKQVNYSFSEAVKHLNEFPDHQMEIEIESEEQE